MTRPVAIPEVAEVLRVVHDLETRDGAPPPVTAVAAELNLSNATFWRHFPQAAQTIADARRSSRRRVREALPETAGSPATNTTSQRAAHAASLQADLVAAAAQIQRLTLENQELRAQLTAARSLLVLRPHGD